MESITLPHQLQKINHGAINGCHNLKQVEIPSTVSSIGGFAFQDDKSLNAVITSGELRQIYYFAFSICDSLQTVVLGEKVEAIGYNAFEYCKHLSWIYSLNPNPPLVNQRFDNGGTKLSTIKSWFTDTFDHIYLDDVTLYVPLGSLDAYQKSSGWKKFKHIKEFDPSTFDPKPLLEIDKTNSFIGTWLGSYISNDKKCYEQLSFNSDKTCTVTTWYEGEENKSSQSYTFIFSDYTLYLSKYEYDDNGGKIGYGYRFPYIITDNILSLTKGKELINYTKQSESSRVHSVVKGNTIDGIFSIRGQKTEYPSKGINIIKMKDGTVKKVLVK